MRPARRHGLPADRTPKASPVAWSMATVLFVTWMMSCEDPPAPAPEAPAPIAAEPGMSIDPEEACAQAVVVGYVGAQHGRSGVRSEADARAAAETLRLELEDGADFLTTAERSDLVVNHPWPGLIGTFPRAEWPARYREVRDAVYQLQVGQLSDVVETPAGFAVIRRCPVEKIAARRIVIQFRGARDAPNAGRSREAARAVAEDLRTALGGNGNFEALARRRSEVPTEALAGGDLGPISRGDLGGDAERIVFALGPGEISDVLETDEGFVIYQRTL